MNAAAQALAARLTEVEKMNVRAAQTEGAVISLYYSYRTELPGGPIHGGTEEDGIAAMKEVVAKVNADFTVDSAQPGFSRGWQF